MSTATPSPRRAIGIVRVSPDNDRGGDTQHSPEAQRASIRQYCADKGWELVDTLPELDVSGGWELGRRTGLRPAIEAVEAGKADVVIVSRFDRLVRSVKVQAEITERVERAGGDLYAIDSGFITNGNATEKMTTHFLGAVSEYHRNTTRERTHEARVRAIANGIPLTPGAPPGYLRPITGTRPNGTEIHGPLQRDPVLAPVVEQAFRMRGDGETVRAVRGFLRGHGVEMTTGGVQRFLGSRTVLGELHAGTLVNLTAHEPIVDRDVWQRVQQVKVPRGRKAKSDRLLARLGILRCASCDSRMTIGSSHGARYASYRCPDTNDCQQRAAISADLVEGVVIGRVRAAVSGMEGRASAEHNVRQAVLDLERAQADLDAAFRAFAGFEDETGARDRLAELRAVRNAAQERVERLGGESAAVTVNAAADWERLTLEGRRALIRATVARVTVAPGRGVDRITVEMVGE